MIKENYFYFQTFWAFMLSQDMIVINSHLSSLITWLRKSYLPLSLRSSQHAEHSTEHDKSHGDFVRKSLIFGNRFSIIPNKLNIDYPFDVAQDRFTIDYW